VPQHNLYTIHADAYQPAQSQAHSPQATPFPTETAPPSHDKQELRARRGARHKGGRTTRVTVTVPTD